MRFLLAILFTVCWLPLYSQASYPEYLLQHISRETVERYIPVAAENHFLVKSSFSDGALEKEDISGKRITRVDYVYSRYRESKDFLQAGLDLKRLNQFFKYYPYLKENDFVKWNFIEQTGCTTQEDCRGYFHGFAIYYEDRIRKERTLREIDSIRASLDHIERLLAEYERTGAYTLQTRKTKCNLPSASTDPEYLQKIIRKNLSCKKKFKGPVQLAFEVDTRGRTTDVSVRTGAYPCAEELSKILKGGLRWRPAIINNKKYPFKATATFTFPLKKNSIVFNGHELPPIYERYGPDSATGEPCMAYTTDTIYTKEFPYKKSVRAVLERNPGWNADLIVTDVTGSMFPHTTELLVWLKLQAEERERHFVFFNDGDDMDDKQKKIGSTGGLYSTTTQDFNQITAKMFEAMAKGGGGDLPENNFEALLAGLAACKSCKEPVMIADNHAFPRDTKLLQKYNGSLKIILCGTEYGLNQAYLNLAYRYRFSIHTRNTDLTNLHDLKDGETIEVDGFQYMLTKRGFQRVYAGQGGAGMLR